MSGRPRVSSFVPHTFMLKRVFSSFADVLRAIAAVGIAVAVAINLSQIVYRYVLFDPLAWTEEAMRYLMVWVTMFGAAASLYRGEEASAGLLGFVKSRAFQTFLHLFRIALVLVFGVLLAWFGLPFALAAKS